MLSLLIFFLLFIVPGFIAVFVFEFLHGGRTSATCKNVSAALVFDLLILLINLIVLFLIKHISTVRELICRFDCLQFTVKYGLLSILTGIILAVVFGFLYRWYHKKR